MTAAAVEIHAVRVPRDKMGNRIYMRRWQGGERTMDTVKTPSCSLRVIGTGEEVDKWETGRWWRVSRKLGCSEVSLFTYRHGVTCQVLRNSSCVASQMLTAGSRFVRNVGSNLQSCSVASQKTRIFRQEATEIITLTAKFGLPQG
jgi:hypothetical protein